MSDIAVRRERRIEVPTVGYRKGQPIEYIKSDWFCIDCGKHDVWQEVDAGNDYYHEYSARCFSCGADICCVSRIEDGR